MRNQSPAYQGWVVFLLVAGWGVMGCGGTTPNPAPTGSETGPETGDPAPYLALFEQSTWPAEFPPPDAPRPFDQTISGKSAFKVVEEVKKAWGTVRLTGPNGKPVPILLEMETSEGNLTIEVHPEWSPIQAKNFLALAKVGYYDGLRLEKIVQAAESGTSRVLQIEGGCPQGRGLVPGGSVGYWLKEDQPTADGKGEKAPQGEGLLGFCQDARPGLASVRFFLSFQNIPPEATNMRFFGKVVQGMDVARKIAIKPVIVHEDEPPGSHSPETPVIIRRVKEKSAPGS